ncbi:unnamed protein product [Protopolystoma xenopodis]|uniref:Uncharacterized protein n=1 Tax=Protopolystoma xenopodis TaxID=117903 RepID=A0A448WJ32_9PLAT|nr:unnamed protein product [Protopolystoma xenopodis]
MHGVYSLNEYHRSRHLVSRNPIGILTEEGEFQLFRHRLRVLVHLEAPYVMARPLRSTAPTYDLAETSGPESSATKRKGEREEIKEKVDEEDGEAKTLDSEVMEKRKIKEKEKQKSQQSGREGWDRERRSPRGWEEVVAGVAEAHRHHGGEAEVGDCLFDYGLPCRVKVGGSCFSCFLVFIFSMYE